MIKNATNQNIIVSYGVMQGGGTNPMGHTYLLFSYHCHQHRRLIVDDAIGFYSTPIPETQTWRRKISEVSFFDKGHLLQEQYCYLIPNGSNQTMQHNHKSWKISYAQYQKIIQDIQIHRGSHLPIAQRNFEQEHATHERFSTLAPEKKKHFFKLKEKEHFAAGGPKFDAFTHSCKTDSLKRLATIGINTAGMHNRVIDLPIYSGKISPHTLQYDEQLKKLIWKTPLELSPHISYEQESPENQKIILAQRQYHLLINNLSETIELFDLKINDLSYKFNTTFLINVLKKQGDQLKQLHHTLLSEGLDPSYLTQENIKKHFNTYRDIIQQTKKTLPSSAKKNLSLGAQMKIFLQNILDKFIDLCTQLSKFFFQPNYVAYSEEYLLKNAEISLVQLESKLKFRPG